MYILNNALKNIGRNKGRNILLMFIILAVIMASAISITINTTTGAIINDYKNRFGSEVSIDLDIEKLIGSSGSQSTQIELITKEQQYSFAESEFLRESIFTGSISVSPVGLKAVDEAEGVGSIISSDEGIDASDFKIPTTVIKGFSETDADDFEKGLRRIVEGKMFADDGECVISKQFAELNGLDVGDEITVETSVTGDDNTLTLKISGIFEDNTMLGVETLFKSALTNRNNEILVDTEDLFGMPLFESAGSLSVKYYLKDPSMLEAFKEELQEKGLTDMYKVTTDEASYNKVVGPVEGLKKITNTFLFVVLVLGAVLIIILPSLAIRERKYEIGVLRAMGMKKGKVALGTAMEMFIITGFCLVIALTAASFAAQPVADSLLADQIAVAEQSETDSGGLIPGSIFVINGSTTEDAVEPLSELDVSITPSAIAQISLVALVIAALSSAVGTAYVMRFEPMRILSERN